MVNGGGDMLLVRYISEELTPLLMLTFHRSIRSVVIGGIVSVVVSVILS